MHFNDTGKNVTVEHFFLKGDTSTEEEKKWLDFMANAVQQILKYAEEQKRIRAIEENNEQSEPTGTTD